MHKVVFKFKIVAFIFTKSLKQYLYRGKPIKQLFFIHLLFIVDILEANYNILLKQICEYFIRRNITG